MVKLITAFQLNIMKRQMKIYLGGLILFMFTFISCKKQDQPVKPVPSPTFSAALAASSLFPSTKTTTTINIVAGTNGWYLTQNPTNSWCVPTKQFGAGDFSLGITLNANTRGLDRTAELTFTSTNKNLSPVKLTITQSK
jgi:hypothetical protein